MDLTDRYYIGNNAGELKKSPVLDVITKVVVVAGTDEDGNQIVGEYGDSNGRTLEVTNELIAPEAGESLQEAAERIAENMLESINSEWESVGGYAYKPFEAEDAFLHDTADLGDAVTIRDVYGVVAKQHLKFDHIGCSDISAPNSDETENEFGDYVPASDRALARKFSGLSTRFTVETGKIEGVIEALDAGLSSRITQTVSQIEAEVRRANAAEGELSSRITMTADSITAEVSRASEAEGDLRSYINMKANEITLGVQATYETKTAANSMESSIRHDMESQIAVSAGQIELHVSETYTTKNELGTSYTNLESKIEQTASNILLSVEGDYAEEWSSDKTYAKNAIVKKTTYDLNNSSIITNITFYKSNYDNNRNKNPATTSGWWALSNSKDVMQSMIDVGIDGITLSVSSDTSGTSSFSLTRNGVIITSSSLDIYVNAAHINGQLTVGNLPDGVATTNTDLSSFANNGADPFTKASGIVSIVEGTVDADYVNGLGVTATKLQVNSSGELAIRTWDDRYDACTISAFEGGSYGMYMTTISSIGSLTLNSDYGTLILSASDSVETSNHIVPTPGVTTAQLGKPEQRWSNIYLYNEPNVSSDRLDKTDIDYSGMERYDELFDQLETCTYKLKMDDRETHFGLIAQDVEVLLDKFGFASNDMAAFCKEENSDATSRPERPYCYALRYGEFIPLLIWEVQQLKKKVRELSND